jgi:hypothetical protein
MLIPVNPAILEVLCEKDIACWKGPSQPKNRASGDEFWLCMEQSGLVLRYPSDGVYLLSLRAASN